MASERDTWEQREDPSAAVRHREEESELASAAVVRAVADLRRCDPTELAPLYDAVDPDSLDRLLARPPPADGHLRISFDYEGARVEAWNDGRLGVRARERPARPETRR